MIRPLVRMATNEEGEDIRYVLESNQELHPDLDWSRVYPHWLVAVHHGIICGCVHILFGSPWGAIDSLTVLPSYQNQGIGAYLAWGAEQVLRQSGVQAMTFTSVNPTIIEGLKRHGAYETGTEKVLYMPIRKKIKNGTQGT